MAHLNVVDGTLRILSSCCRRTGFASVILFLNLGFILIAEVKDPFLVKEYPDGTKVKIRWSQIGRTLDTGATHGGPPTMRAIQPGEDNIPEADPASGAQSQRDMVVAPPVQEAAADPVLAPAVSSQEKGSRDVKVLKVYPDGTQVGIVWFIRAIQ